MDFHKAVQVLRRKLDAGGTGRGGQRCIGRPNFAFVGTGAPLKPSSSTYGKKTDVNRRATSSKDKDGDNERGHEPNNKETNQSNTTDKKTRTEKKDNTKHKATPYFERMDTEPRTRTKTPEPEPKTFVTVGFCAAWRQIFDKPQLFLYVCLNNFVKKFSRKRSFQNEN